jgi:hypothetical protein
LAPHVDHPRADAGPSQRAYLEVELRAPERQTIATFRESFLRWLNDRSGPLTRLLGPADLLSIDEVPPPAGSRNVPSTLRLRISWSRVSRIVSSRPARPTDGSGPGVPDYFGSFPDELQESPLRHVPVVPATTVSVPSNAGRPAVPKLPVASRFAETMQSMWTAARRATSAARVPRLPFHIPSPTELSGLRSFVTLATAAAVVGFMVGALFLSEIERPERSAAAAARFAPPQSLAAGLVSTPSTAPGPTVKPASRSLTGGAAPVAAASTGKRDANAPTSARSDKAVATSGTAPTSTRSSTKALTAPPAPRLASTRRSSSDAAIVTADAKGSNTSSWSGAKGTLYVTSDPQGAAISINGVAQGKTPMLIRGVAAGSRVLRLDLAGYEPWSWSVRVPADTRTPVTVKLHAEARNSSSQQH